MPDAAVVLTPDHPFVAAVAAAIRATYGERLRAIALFGSVARRTARMDSDLDLLLIVDGLPNGRRARLDTFDAVEARLRDAARALERTGVTADLSPVLRTPEDLLIASPLLLDLTEDAVVLEDRGGILRATLDDLRERLRRAGVKGIWQGTRWYWDLEPDYRRGEIVRI
jgi:predicted nucleotidyltransferase